MSGNDGGQKGVTLKDRMENNFTLYTLSLLFAGFCAGLVTYKSVQEIAGPNKLEVGECVEDVWKASARNAAWLPSGECPAYPLGMKINSPGDRAVISFSLQTKTWLRTPIVIASTRSVPEKSTVGIILKPANAQNYYVVFPYFDYIGSRSVFRTDSLIDLPFELMPEMDVEMRPLIVDEKKKLGGVFSDLEQIKASDLSVFIGDSIQIRVR